MVKAGMTTVVTRARSWCARGKCSRLWRLGSRQGTATSSGSDGGGGGRGKEAQGYGRGWGRK